MTVPVCLEFKIQMTEAIESWKLCQINVQQSWTVSQVVVELDNNLYLYKYENVCVCVCVFSRFSRPFGIRLEYPLAQMCFVASKWF